MEELGKPGRYEVRVNPRDISTALGQGRANVKRLEAEGYTATFIQDASVDRGNLKVSPAFSKAVGVEGAKPHPRRRL